MDLFVCLRAHSGAIRACLLNTKANTPFLHYLSRPSNIYRKTFLPPSRTRRYDPGDMDVHKPNTPLPTTTTTDRTDPIVFYDDGEIFVPKHQRASSSASLFPSKPTKSTAIATVSSDLFRGTLGPSPEPQPATIDRWARGWLGSRSAKMRDGVSVKRKRTSFVLPVE